jgi:hypothetical protein
MFENNYCNYYIYILQLGIVTIYVCINTFDFKFTISHLTFPIFENLTDFPLKRNLRHTIFVRFAVESKRCSR